MTKLFISYRRDDARYAANRLHAALKPYVADPTTDLFIDIDSIPAGVDFAKHLKDRAAACDVLLAVIGPGWIDARDAGGRRRLDDPADFVRIEIAAALQRNVPVVPVLLDGASVPTSDQLPDDLKPLVMRNGLPVHLTSFDADVARLVSRLPVDMPVRRLRARPRVPLLIGALVLMFSGLALTLADPFGWGGADHRRSQPSAIEIPGAEPLGHAVVAPAETIRSEPLVDAAPEPLAIEPAPAVVPAPRNTGIEDFETAQSAFGREDYATAARHYERACLAGEARGCTDFGFLVQNGLAVEQDDARAMVLYTQACDAGDARGCTYTGQLHEKGRGVEASELLARQFYQKGCDAGDSMGCDFAARLP
jgi:TIR domain/Sel1 repeat